VSKLLPQEAEARGLLALMLLHDARRTARRSGEGDLNGYYLLAAARADMLRRLERLEPAACAYKTAFQQATQEADRRFLTRRLAEVEVKLGREVLCSPNERS
jgi:predicted RNA polymerase sigma factor